MRSSSPQRRLRVLLDECVPVQLRHALAGHDVRTVLHVNWRSLRNGDLLNAAEREGFDVFVTADRGIPRNHDLAGWRLAMVVVPTNRRKILLAMTDLLREAIERVSPGECEVIRAVSEKPEPS